MMKTFIKTVIRHKKILLIAAIAIIIAGAVAAYIFTNSARAAGNNLQQNLAIASYKDISKYIEASGPIESAERKEIVPKVTSTVEIVNFNEGDEVKKGDVMFVLDDTDVLLDIEEMNNNIATSRINYDNLLKDIESLKIKAPFSGIVTGISVEKGDELNAGATVLTLTDTSELTLTVPFGGSGVTSVKAGDSATVYLPDMMASVGGTVTYVSSTPYISEKGETMYSVEIKVKNPGSLTEGTSADAEISTAQGVLKNAEPGVLKYINKKL